MDLKKTLNTEIIYQAIYNLVKSANCILPKCVYEKIKNYQNIGENLKSQILQNAYLAKENMRPLCQDCGQVVVFINIGQDVILTGNYLEDVVNKSIEDSYRDNYFRKSVVVDAIFNRDNTKTNTPCVIHTQIVKGDKVEITVGIKGGGAENTSNIKMFNPTASIDEIKDFIIETANNTKGRACPPMSIGVGAGGTLEEACILAKKALFFGKELDLDIKDCFEVKMLTSKTHIACLPVCVNINCHSARHGKCEIVNTDGEYKIRYENNNYDIEKNENDLNLKEVFTSDINQLKSLKVGENVALTGKIYTARDMAHKKLVELINNKENLPINLSGAVIFYAGPCPSAPNEIIGPIGPTTSKRMDAYAPVLYKNGVLATIGKGDREIKGGLYFEVTGGVASLIQQCVKSSKVVGFIELGAEAIYELQIEKMPVTLKSV